MDQFGEGVDMSTVQLEERVEVPFFSDSDRVGDIELPRFASVETINDVESSSFDNVLERREDVGPQWDERNLDLDGISNNKSDVVKESTVDNQDIDKKDIIDEEKLEINEAGWSDEIIDVIGCREEYDVYKNAGLVEVEIDGDKCLMRNDIDWNQKDVMGRTNKERTEQNLSPINKEGKIIELHHIGQHADSPLAELTQEEHRGRGNDSILHNKTKETEIDRREFASQRNSHWTSRGKEIE